MLVISLFVSIILLPIYLPTLLIFYVFQQIIYTILKIKYKSRLQLLDSADVYWAVGENHHNQSYILTILKDRGYGNIVTEIKTIINEELMNHSLNYKKILSSLHICLGYPYLLSETYQAEDFITILEIENNSNKSIKDIIYDFGGKHLPLNGKLLWEIIVIKATEDWKLKEGLKIDQIPLILRENHTLTDGLSLMNLMANSFGDQTVDLSAYLKNIPKSENSNIVLHFFNTLFLFLLVPGYFIVEIVQKKFKRNLFKGSQIVNKPIISYKCEKENTHLVESIKSLKRDIGDTSFTEIVIAAISASLQNYFLKDGYKIPDYMLLMVVFTKDLKPMTFNDVSVLRNQFGMINFELPIKCESNSMLKRLETLKRKTRPLLKTPTSLVDSFVLFNLMGLFPTSIIKRFFPMAETVGMSNLPGFPKINICNGYEVEDVYFFVPQRDTNGIGFSVLTYDNRLHIGLTADEASISSRDACENIVNDFFKFIEDLKQEVHKTKLEMEVIDIEISK